MPITKALTPPSRLLQTQPEFDAQADIFFAEWPEWNDEVNAVQADINDKYTDIIFAADAAATALNYAEVLATSTSTLTVGTGSKSLTLAQTGKGFAVGQSVNISNSTASMVMNGYITAFNSGTGAITVDVTNIRGTGTAASWTISIGAPGLALGSTTVNGMIKGDGTAIVEAVDGVDYLSPLALADQTNKIKSWTSSELTLTAASPGSTGSVSHVKAVALDADRDLILFGGSALFGIVKNNTTGAIGGVTLIRNANVGNVFQCLKVAPDKALVWSCNATTGIEAVCLTFSGTTITVNTAATATASSTVTACYQLIAVNSSFVVSFATTAMRVMAMTVTGTTVAIGAETSTSITSGANALLAMGAVLVAIGNTATPTLMARPYTVSGTTLTSGTDGTVASRTFTFATPFLTGGRVAVFSVDASGYPYGHVLALSGTVASFTSVQMQSSTANAYYPSVGVVGAQVIGLFCGSSGNCVANVLTDSTGTAVAGTATANIGNTTDQGVFGLFGSEMIFNAPGVATHAVGISGNNPVLRPLITTNYGLNKAHKLNQSANYSDPLPRYAFKSSAGAVSISPAAETGAFYQYYNPTTELFEPVNAGVSSFALVYTMYEWARPSNSSGWAVMPTNAAQTKVKLQRFWIS